MKGTRRLWLRDTFLDLLGCEAGDAEIIKRKNEAAEEAHGEEEGGALGARLGNPAPSSSLPGFCGVGFRHRSLWLGDEEEHARVNNSSIMTPPAFPAVRGAQQTKRVEQTSTYSNRIK